MHTSPQGTWEEAQWKLPDSTQPPRHLKENTVWRLEAGGCSPLSGAEAVGEGEQWSGIGGSIGPRKALEESLKPVSRQADQLGNRKAEHRHNGTLL